MCQASASPSGTLPEEQALLQTAGPAVPAVHAFGFAIPMIATATAAALRLPAALRHLRLAAAHRPGADLDTLALPQRIMPVTGTDQSVRNLVQQGVANQVRAVALGEVNGQLDGLGVVPAEAQRSLAPIERERPMGKTILSQELEGQLAHGEAVLRK